jgi:Family of unknown function (DUF5694)
MNGSGRKKKTGDGRHQWLVALSLFVAISGSAPAHAADSARTQVLLIATYHFANPGQDLNNVKSVDVLAPKRQREVSAVVQALARFAPTQVAVEWPATVVAERYPKYLDGTLPESRNEVVQLGFRLARERKLPSVLGLDVEGDFPFDAVTAWAGKNGRSAEIDALLAAGKQEVERISALQDRTTIGGVLRDFNTDEAVARNHAFYPRLLTLGAGVEQPGVKLLAAWYERNLAICARLLQHVKSADRVVAFYGQGHIYLLRQCLREQPTVQLVDPLDYLAGT